MVKAIVVREDADGCLGLRFDKVTDVVATRLEQIVSALPPLVDARQAKPGVVVSQVVERISRPWLKDGWQRAREGETVAGYGFWESKRPRWEPRFERCGPVAAVLWQIDS